MINEGTRGQILALLKKHGAKSAGEIAEMLNITVMAVRRHLQNLEKDRLLTTKLIRQPMGRPSHVYLLTEHSEQLFPKNYADITIDFLKDVQELHGPETVNLLFERREQRLADKYKQAIQSEELENRVAELAQLQDQRGYMAEWTKGDKPGQYFLTEHNCPIHQIAYQFKKACSSELSLFRDVLGAEVEQLECKAKGGERCVYAISPKSKR